MEIQIDGTWVGFYQYPKTFFSRGEQVPCVAHLIDFGGENFEGIIEDEVVNGGVQELATVKGNLSGKKIAFVKTYPSHSVMYKGEYTETEEKFFGTWVISRHWSGYWEMKKGSIKQTEKEEAKMVIGN